MARMFAVHDVVRWQKPQIDQMKQEIRAELEVIPPEERVDYLLRQIAFAENSEDTSSNNRLRLFVLSVSLLVQHSKNGGLARRVVKRIANLAHAVLQTEGIQPVTSRLAWLYGELHLAQSQIFMKTGDHWRAAWEQQLSQHLSGAEQPGGESFQKLSLASRSLRLGHAVRAAELYAAAEGSKSNTIRCRARLGQIRSLRLAGKPIESAALAGEARAHFAYADAEQRELVWENSCRKLSLAGDPRPLFRLVRRGQSHALPVYQLEAHLWAKCLPEKRMTKSLPKVSYLGRKPQVKSLGMLYTAALTLEHCYDQEVPMVLRIRALGEALASVRDLVTVESELLFLGAAARWLARSHLFPMASLVLAEYQLLSIRLSSGTTGDITNLLSDLLAKEWFTGKGAEKETATNQAAALLLAS